MNRHLSQKTNSRKELADTLQPGVIHDSEPARLDDFAESVARKLQARGITAVPGLPETQSWKDRVIETLTDLKRIGEQSKARQAAEKEQRNNPPPAPPPTLTQHLRELVATRQHDADTPALNSDRLLDAAAGTTQQTESPSHTLRRLLGGK